MSRDASGVSRAARRAIQSPRDVPTFRVAHYAIHLAPHVLRFAFRTSHSAFRISHFARNASHPRRT
ncbi:hypothetical protein EZV77_09545 [Burkholderia thailandensis]|nr:hypothetical protein CWD92_28765 [Burkholderia thailandensis]TBW65144.1 hypothetical protein EZV77_09545 [Burkholderia thailandensis]